MINNSRMRMLYIIIMESTCLKKNWFFQVVFFVTRKRFFGRFWKTIEVVKRILQR